MTKNYLCWINAIFFVLVLFSPATSCSKQSDTETNKIFGTLADIDSNLYKTIQIGSQTWMAENLKTTRYNDSTLIPLLNDSTYQFLDDSPYYCWYYFSEAGYKIPYGALYSWYTINTGKLCPTGWHVPDSTEWSELVAYLGGSDIAGGKMKESGTLHWESPNVGATNSSGFTALPGGVYYFLYRESVVVGYMGDWWNSTETDTSQAVYWNIENVSTTAKPYICDKNNGLSVRCIKD